jgi:hypothetical protein
MTEPKETDDNPVFPVQSDLLTNSIYNTPEEVRNSTYDLDPIVLWSWKKKDNTSWIPVVLVENNLYLYDSQISWNDFIDEYAFCVVAGEPERPRI